MEAEGGVGVMGRFGEKRVSGGIDLNLSLFGGV
jgi:hypothetical protein